MKAIERIVHFALALAFLAALWVGVGITARVISYFFMLGYNLW